MKVLTSEPSKTQIALDYAYRRCDTNDDCCIFWVHADSEATFLADYKTIGKKLGVDERLDGSDLFAAVRNEIEARPKWLMILDNADDLRLFGVGQGKEKGMNEGLYKHVPCTSQGTVLWTSRDAHIAGTLVGARRGIEVQSMAVGEATTLLARTRDESLVAEGEASGKVSGEAGVDALLEELQCLPLAISQAGAYMRRMSMSAEQYLSLLRPGKTRWELLKVSDADRHRRPEVSNSILETWRLSIERIRLESEMSYRILHVIAYIDSQDIPQELMVAAASGCDTDDKDSELKVLEAVVRLKEFSFLSLRQTDDGRRYEMHKLVQEAIRYGLRVRDSAVKTVGNASRADSGPKEDEGYYCGKALQVVNDLFPLSEPKSWISCEQYVTHAIRVSDWAEVSGTEVATSTLLERVSYFLYDRGRWREREPVGSRAWSLRRKVLGEKHPDTISSMANLGATYHALGRHNDAQEMAVKVLELRREALGRDKHPDIMSSMTDLATTYYTQGQYTKAQGIYQEVLDVRLELLGEKHPDTIKSMADLATAYHALRQYDKAKAIYQEVLGLRLEVFGEKHPAISKSMADLAATCHAQGRHDEAKKLKDKALALRREMLGETHPDTISSIADLGVTYHAYGRYDEALQLHQTALDHRRQLLGENHPDTLQSAAYLASTQDALQQLRSLEERKPWTRLLSKFKHQRPS
jgi:tetratricopeptide (TPR) repeat protein